LQMEHPKSVHDNMIEEYEKKKADLQHQNHNARVWAHWTRRQFSGRIFNVRH
jgi:hypothetical protein